MWACQQGIKNNKFSKIIFHINVLDPCHPTDQLSSTVKLVSYNVIGICPTAAVTFNKLAVISPNNVRVSIKTCHN